jgi:hypothetical protein
MRWGHPYEVIICNYAWSNYEPNYEHKEEGTLFRIQEDLTANQQKVYKETWEEAGRRGKSGTMEEWTVVGLKSKPRLVLKKRLEENYRMTKEERGGEGGRSPLSNSREQQG